MVPTTVRRSCVTEQTSSFCRRLIGLTLTGFVCLLGILYLVETNAVATKGYEILKLQSDVKTLRQEGGKLELESASLQSLGGTNQVAGSSTFVAVERIEYLAAATPQGGVAVK